MPDRAAAPTPFLPRCLDPAKSSLQNNAVLRNRVAVLRIVVRLGLIALAVAASLGAAAAQTYAPLLPGDYDPAPPVPYPAQPQASSPAPVPPLGVGGGEYATAPPDPGAYGAPAPYDPRYERADQEAPGAYPPPPPYGVPSARARMPADDGGPLERPPADVGGAPARPDFTGSVDNPAASGAAPAPDRSTLIAALPPEDQPERGPPKQLPPQFRRQLVDYVTTEPAGTIIIDTPHTYLYLVLGRGKAIRYGIGVGREGFTWSGTERISRMTEWPDWHPPKEMIERQPYLPRFMAGGESNPLGARALYLGNTLYRIHGTNQPSTIGHFVSSGCIRLTNADIEDLYSRVNVGSRVVVLPGSPPSTAMARGPRAR